MINYEEKVDCFKKTEHVKSTFIYGDKNIIKNPIITVFIPTYKRVDLLKQAIESVISQWHTDFDWDIIVVDNEPYDGKPNATEHLIRKIDNPRILYYRNSENMRPGDNFNRGILLARGKWVMMLHDDDLLIRNTIVKIKNLIDVYTRISKKQIAAFSAYYVQIVDDNNKNEMYKEIYGINEYFSNIQEDYKLHKLSRMNIWFTSHMGGFAPSNGTTYNREAVINSGGFNENLGIFCDLILFYNMQKKYDVYCTLTPIGIYRWGRNLSMNVNTTFKFINESMNFREYIYNVNILTKLFGNLFRSIHYEKFAKDVINDRNSAAKKMSHNIKINYYNDFINKKPNYISKILYSICSSLYNKYKKTQTKLNSRKAKRIFKRISNGKNI